ncbi:MAG: 16S rRNA (guanine(527)-N(7))-methyltransferase RsmG [Candidatus Eremiobacteraeota bacterium]|nr:16S rRNA (guanine(527)-N(7))-methyltransferase RsmG [Candidatus Eremiobacteraeota bacterium]
MQLEARSIESLARYGALVLETNQRFNLTGAKNGAELAAHVIDSLTLLPFVRTPLVDVGSGAGLPAIPLAIATATAINVTLVEATRKKARFLACVLQTFGLQGEVVPLRAEVAAHDERLRERFASGTARAVALAPVVLELVLPFLRVGGSAVLARGRMDARERGALEDAATMLGGFVEAEHRLEDERRIVVVRKTQPTPERFPRRTGVPEKRPLCLPRDD